MEIVGTCDPSLASKPAQKKRRVMEKQDFFSENLVVHDYLVNPDAETKLHSDSSPHLSGEWIIGDGEVVLPLEQATGLLGARTLKKWKIRAPEAGNIEGGTGPPCSGVICTSTVLPPRAPAAWTQPALYTSTSRELTYEVSNYKGLL
ncbi:hypothetical protein M0R45_009556 [Rubus argutus]|uniref:Uncharacterized protein n=1 Tax=Rubus argutus TaxID=59490 RepID=A0AAW1Y4U1_RUBAR